MTMDSVQEITTNISLALSMSDRWYTWATRVQTSHPFLTFAIFHRYEALFLQQHISQQQQPLPGVLYLAAYLVGSKRLRRVELRNSLCT
jgi:hypothetical protein